MGQLGDRYRRFEFTRFLATWAVVAEANSCLNPNSQNVLRPAFLDRFSTRGLRKFDRIQVTADCRNAGELAMLLVEENPR